MFSGEYSHSLDTKNRLMLPAKLRSALGEELVLAKNVDKCLSLYPKQTWEEFCRKLDSQPSMQVRAAKRFLIASAFETPQDNQGRILIPQKLYDYAGLAKEVTIIGVGDHLELWDTAAWEALSAEQNGEEIANLLKNLGF